MNEKYKDIIDLPNHRSKKYPHMSMIDRAAQFGSFDALTGHSDAIKETARLTDKKIQLNEEQINDLNFKINIICDNIMTKPLAAITYFIPDEKKSGGMYLTESQPLRARSLRYTTHRVCLRLLRLLRLRSLISSRR